MTDSGGTDRPPLLDIARAAIAEDPVCDACLGRLVADRSHGLANAERGQALRTTVAMQDNVPVDPPDPSECWVCEGESDRLDYWAEQAVAAVTDVAFATYQVGCRVPPLLEENDRLLRELCSLPPDSGEPLKRELNREVGKRLGARTGTSVDFERPDVLLLLHIERGTVERSINPAFVYGRYRKLERDIPQTEWPCTDCGATGKQLGANGEEDCAGCDGTGYRYDLSVEGATVPHVVEAMDGAEGIFHGAGREDVDARMLGDGRPFVIEVKEPHFRRPDLDTLQARINQSGSGAVAVDDLELVTHEMVERVKELEASKTYRMDVALEAPVEKADVAAAVSTLIASTIEQRTPTRVSHRRADRVRTRQVYSMTVLEHEGPYVELEAETAGGLYVKELVSGNEGRTTPSLAGELGVGATVTALDVTDVAGEGERFLTDDYRIDQEP